jgi:hypothetical protein
VLLYASDPSSVSGAFRACGFVAELLGFFFFRPEVLTNSSRNNLWLNERAFLFGGCYAEYQYHIETILRPDGSNYITSSGIQ